MLLEQKRNEPFLWIYTFLESLGPISPFTYRHPQVSLTTAIPGLSRNISNRGSSIILCQGKRPIPRASSLHIQDPHSSLWNHCWSCLLPKLTLFLAKFYSFHFRVHHSPSWWCDRSRRERTDGWRHLSSTVPFLLLWQWPRGRCCWEVGVSCPSLGCGLRMASHPLNTAIIMRKLIFWQYGPGCVEHGLPFKSTCLK